MPHECHKRSKGESIKLCTTVEIFDDGYGIVQERSQTKIAVFGHKWNAGEGGIQLDEKLGGSKGSLKLHIFSDGQNSCCM